MGWLVVTGGIVLALVGLSFLALDKPNVVWSVGRASCPHCRTAVPAFARRCPTCREEFDRSARPRPMPHPVPSASARSAASRAARDRRVRVGLEAPHTELERYRAAATVLTTPSTPLDMARAEVGKANEGFLRRYSGTLQASELWFPPLFLGGESGGTSPRAATMARLRLQNALNALKAP
jgi:hypothetical protein